MDTVADLSQNLRRSGVTFWTDGENIHYHSKNGNMQGKLLSQIKENKTAVISFLQNRSYEVSRYPATHSQRALWNIWKRDKTITAYHTAISMKIPDLDAERLIRMFRKAIIRHQALRTRFTSVDGQLYQQIFNDLSPDQQLLNVRHASKEEIQQIITEHYEKPFDLENGAPIRLTFLRVSEQTTIFLLTAHHIILDGASGWQLLKEVFEEYSGQNSFPDVSPYQMSDFSTRQHQLLDSDTATELSEYWSKALSGAPYTVNLPEDFSRPAEHRYKGSTVPVMIPEQLSKRLRLLARELDVTLYTLLLSAYQILLGRYTGQTDLLIGSPANGRTEAEHDRIVGFLVNMIVLRADLSDNIPFHEFVLKTNQNVRQSFAHQDYPFQLVASELSDHSDKSRHPLFQAEFALQQVRGNADILRLYNPAEKSKKCMIGSVEVEPYHTFQQEGQFDLGLDLIDLSDELSGMVRYNSDLFEEKSILQLVDRYITLLESICNNSNERIDDLDIINRDEYGVLKERITPLKEPKLPYENLIDWFDSTCEQHPDKIAVRDKEKVLTYRELQMASRLISEQLCGKDSGANLKKPIGICMKRSVNLIAGIIGIMRSGSPYVPLDPSNAKSRLEFIASDSDLSCVLTDSANSGKINCSEILIDEDILQNPSEVQIDTAKNPGPEDIAYIIYTSGSTGKPKGALVSHQNVMRLFTSTEPWFSFSQDDRWLMFHSYAFDFSVWEIWGALLYGGELTVADADQVRFSDQIAELVHQNRISVLNQTPSSFNHLSGEILKRPKEDFSHLKWVVFGGEALNTASLIPWFNHFGDQKPALINMYGITETTVHVTHYRLRISDTLKHHSPIGEPIPDLGLSIRNAKGKLVPDNIPGELYVSGAGVCKMYLNREKLNGERFSLDEFGRKMYRSGDIVRRLNDGRVVYIGRSDQQIKIRGYRIEAGEIEYALMQHDKIQTAAVGIHEAKVGKKIVAWCTPDGSDLPIESDLKIYLKKILPEYMIPSFIFVLDSLPVTPNGKLDTSRLPLPENSVESKTIQYSADQDPLLWIAQICSSVLQKEEVPYHLNFFDLGCDSLSINLIYRKLHEQLGSEIKVTDLYEYPTIDQLSQKIASIRRSNGNHQTEKSVSVLDRQNGSQSERNHTDDTDKKSRMDLLKERRRRSR